MKKIIVFNMVSVDGFFAGPNGEIDWHMVDEEFNEFAIKQLAEFGTLMFGRITYGVMYPYWPSEEALRDDPIVAGLMNNANKIVFSRTIQKADWNNTKVIKEVNKEEIEKLKQASDKDIAIFGSGQICKKLTKLGLVDEYRLLVNPVTLGKGKPLFTDRGSFKLLKTREFNNGNVLLCYKVKS
jgi:dihydrofolate reductase